MVAREVVCDLCSAAQRARKGWLKVRPWRSLLSWFASGCGGWERVEKRRAAGKPGKQVLMAPRAADRHPRVTQMNWTPTTSQPDGASIRIQVKCSRVLRARGSLGSWRMGKEMDKGGRGSKGGEGGQVREGQRSFLGTPVLQGTSPLWVGQFSALGMLLRHKRHWKKQT